MDYKKEEVFRIDMFTYDDGEVRFDYNDKNSSIGLFDSLLKAIIVGLAETELLTKEEVDSYCYRIDNDHGEVIEIHILDKIKEALKLADGVKGEFYQKQEPPTKAKG